LKRLAWRKSARWVHISAIFIPYVNVEGMRVSSKVEKWKKDRKEGQKEDVRKWLFEGAQAQE
jgi:hypothetical protein